MIGETRHLGKKLYEFFDIYPLATIREAIGENVADTQRTIYSNICKNTDDHKKTADLAEIFRNSVTGYSPDVYRDMISYAAMAKTCHEYLHENKKQNTPSESYFLKRVKASAERGFNPNVKLDRFLEEFDNAVNATWHKMSELNKAGIEYIGELVALDESDVFSGQEPHMTRFIMNYMLREEGLSLQHWKAKKSRPSAAMGPKGG